MPLLRIETNQDLERVDTTASHFIRIASKHLSDLLGKSEDYIMVTFSENPAMLFGGKGQPLAYVELKSLGLPEDQTTEISKSLCELIFRELRIPTNQIYIEFTNGQRHMWGWDKKTF